MDDDRRSHRTAVVLFAVAVIIAVIAAFITTFEAADYRYVSNNEAQPGTIGLARPHPPLDRAPGEPARN
jgi:hypothetical protein